MRPTNGQPITSNHRRALAFRRMLARDAGPGAGAAAVAAAARALCEHFARLLTPLIGDAGVAAILARCLYLAQRHASDLPPVRASNRHEGAFASQQRFLEQLEPAAALEAAVALLTAVSELLVSFIGEGLTTQFLREAWPDDFADDSTEETLT
ncbi:MAG: hypothetical protein ABL982_04970 [Vicinamibacterales bacterium]